MVKVEGLMKDVKRHFFQFAAQLVSRPLEFHVYLISRWLTEFASQPLVSNSKRAIVFSPHEDDETLGCGGMIAWKRSHNIPVAIVFVTDGQKAHLFTPWIESPPDLVEIRRQEAIKAASVLGVAAANVHFLNYEDAALQDLPEQARQQLIEQITQLLLTYQPEEVYVPHRKDVHPDHEATYAVVKAAIAQTRLQVQVWQYPIWLMWESLLFWGLKLEYLTHAYRFAIDSVRQQKQEAIAVYESQHPLLPPGMLKVYQNPYELYFRDNN
jgi:LmbE family N-acetylglucosaminyl deacetylase